MNSWSKKRSVMRRYNLTAQMYDDRYRAEQEAKYKTALEGLNLNCNSVVLDVGCGTGLFFRHMANNGDLVVGVDVSRQLLLLAKDRIREHGNVFVVLADADHLPFKPQVFEFTFAFTVLQNMPKPVETLKQLVAVSTHDAFFVVTWLKAAVSLEVFGELLEDAGLQVVSFRNDDSLRCHVVRRVKR